MGPSCQSVVEMTEKKRKKVEGGVREKSEMRNSSHVEPESKLKKNRENLEGRSRERDEKNQREISQ